MICNVDDFVVSPATIAQAPGAELLVEGSAQPIEKELVNEKV